MNALIITDGTEAIHSIALSIEKIVPDFKLKICSVQDFEGNEILPADIFFIGCEEPSPSSFSFLETMLAHINLAPRKCGVFSINEKSNNYLAEILKDCEASVGEPLLVSNGSVKESDLKKWVSQIANND